MEKETQLQMDLPEVNQEPKQPTQEEMLALLSQTVVQQDGQIKTLKEELSKAHKEISLLQDELRKPNSGAMEAEESARHRHITDYLENELAYAKAKIAELRHHLIDYPEDEYSRVDLQNSLLHLNYLHAMIRRLHFYN